MDPFAMLRGTLWLLPHVFGKGCCRVLGIGAFEIGPVWVRSGMNIRDWYKYTSLTERATLQKRKRPVAVSYEALGLSLVSAGNYVAFLEMYIDESYGSPSPNIVVGGFVSHIDLWARFAQAWKQELLERYRVPYLHLSELWNPNAAIYSHLKEQQHDEIFQIARSLIRDHALMGVGFVINQYEFNDVFPSSQRGQFGTAYTIGVRGCISEVSDHCANLPLRPEISVFLEDGHRNTKQAITLLKKARKTQG